MNVYLRTLAAKGRLPDLGPLDPENPLPRSHVSGPPTVATLPPLAPPVVGQAGAREIELPDLDAAAHLAGGHEVGSAFQGQVPRPSLPPITEGRGIPQGSPAPRSPFPQRQQLPPIPRDQSDPRGMGRTALIAGLFGLLGGGGGGALSAAVGAGQGFQQGQQQRRARDLSEWQLQARQVENVNDDAIRDWSLQSADAHRQAQEQRQARQDQSELFDLQMDAVEGDAKRQRLARLDERQAGLDRQALTGKAATERRAVLKELSGLDPASQQTYLAVLADAGELDRLGIETTKGPDGKYVLGPLAKAPSPSKTPAVSPRERRLERELAVQYRNLANPRITERGAENVAKRIAQLQAALGYGDGSGQVEIVLDRMTPDQRLRAEIALQNLELAKERNRQADERLGLARKRLALSPNAAPGEVYQASRLRYSAVGEAILSHQRGLDALEKQRAALPAGDERDKLTERWQAAADKLRELKAERAEILKDISTIERKHPGIGKRRGSSSGGASGGVRPVTLSVPPRFRQLGPGRSLTIEPIGG